ncbi:MAG: hypothetical protein JNM25_12560 [Planctomycetes bacterium]|nr:hypothetical protein [Planctomycetota bacterium]
MRTYLLLAGLLLANAAPAQSVLPPFNDHYQVTDLGQMPGVFNYSGITFLPGSPNVLLASAYQSGQIRAVNLVRDGQGRVTGFAGSTQYATVGGNDGGLAFGPGGVLFFTWYGQNRLGQILPGGTAASRVDSLAPLGVPGSVGSCAFVPAGRSGAGRFKLASYGGSQWYDVTLAADGSGTFAIQSIQNKATLQGGPEGILYPPAQAPLLGNAVLIAEWNAGIAAYQVDANGDPLPATRQPFLIGLSGNSGGAIDPITGDFLFAGNGGRLARIESSAACGPIVGYGAATPGTAFTPVLTATGCARLGQQLTLRIDGAPNAFGVLAIGRSRIQYDFGGLLLLTTLDALLNHSLDATGRLQVPWDLVDPSLGDTHFYLQAGYLDAGSPSGLCASSAIDIWIR